jgi:hypothetical protein
MAKAATPSRMVLRRRSPLKAKAKLASKPIGKAAPTKVVRLAAKKAVTKREVKKASHSKDSKLLELCLLLDCTGSMGSWIERAKKTLKEIVDNIVRDNEGKLRVRVCFVGYRDHCDGKNRYSIKGFTEDIEEMKKFISDAVNAQGGGDTPEDVVGGMRKCLDQAWTPNSSK